MKVNFRDEGINEVKVGTLHVGDTFCGHSWSNPDQTALYMIVDVENDYIKQNKLFNPYGYQLLFLAVNLATGQLKEYLSHEKVIPIDADNVSCL